MLSSKMLQREKVKKDQWFEHVQTWQSEQMIVGSFTEDQVYTAPVASGPTTLNCQ